METIIDLFGVQVRGDYLLTLISVIITTLAGAYVALIKRRRVPQKIDLDEMGSDLDKLAQILKNPEVIELIKSENAALMEILSRFGLGEENRPIGASEKGIIDKISQDIKWDIAGVIGILVTIVLLFMTVSGTIPNVPEQIFNGWLLILGFYFGKGKSEVSN